MAEAKSLRHEKPFNANEQDSPAQGKFKKTPSGVFFIMLIVIYENKIKQMYFLLCTFVL